MEIKRNASCLFTAIWSSFRYLQSMGVIPIQWVQTGSCGCYSHMGHCCTLENIGTAVAHDWGRNFQAGWYYGYTFKKGHICSEICWRTLSKDARVIKSILGGGCLCTLQLWKHVEDFQFSLTAIIKWYLFLCWHPTANSTPKDVLGLNF